MILATQLNFLFLLEKFKIKNPIARGLALGASGHALGVAVGIELGEVEAAMASIAVVVVGVVTVIVVPAFAVFVSSHLNKIFNGNFL